MNIQLLKKANLVIVDGMVTKNRWGPKKNKMIRLSGGTGIRGGLRNRCLRACRFDSCLGYYLEKHFRNQTMIWKRDKIRDLLKDLDCSVEKKEPGGDYDIVGFFITPNGSNEWIAVTPFKDPGICPDEVQDNCEIYAVEVRTNGDCTGGLQTKDEKVAIAYGRVYARLSKEGFLVIAHYDEIF